MCCMSSVKDLNSARFDDIPLTVTNGHPAGDWAPRAECNNGAYATGIKIRVGESKIYSYIMI